MAFRSSLWDLCDSLFVFGLILVSLACSHITTFSRIKPLNKYTLLLCAVTGPLLLAVTYALQGARNLCRPRLSFLLVSDPVASAHMLDLFFTLLPSSLLASRNSLFVRFAFTSMMSMTSTTLECQVVLHAI
jgi:hypothetical protein